MTRILILTLLFVSGFTTSAEAAVATPPVAVQETIITRADMEAKLGRKLNFRERIAVKIMAGKQKKQARKARRGGDGYGNGFAIAGFVFGILSLLGLSIIAGIPAIVFSAIGLGKANREGRPHRGLAIAGLVCGILSFVLLFLLIVLFFAAWGFT